MMKLQTALTNADHADMKNFLAIVLDDYKYGKTSKEDVINKLAHVISALDCDNYAEVRSWFKQPHFTTNHNTPLKAD